MSTDPPPTQSPLSAAAGGPAFTAQPLDRADRERKDDAWVTARLADPASRAIIISRDSVLIEEAAARVARVPLPDEAGTPLLLGVEDGVVVFVCDTTPNAAASADPTDGSWPFDPEPGSALVDVRATGMLLSSAESGLAAYALALVNWHRRHRFCANCGTATEVREAGYMRKCPHCGVEHFPQVDPVVIMLVEHDGSLLLGRRGSWPARQYSALAGFVSPGEAVEEAVLREVFEESTIHAHTPSFMVSQPWPFPASLMLGFHALSDGGTPVARDGELEDVRWFTAEEIRHAQVEEATRGAGVDAPGPLKLPPAVAVARFMIDRWLAERDRAVT